MVDSDASLSEPKSIEPVSFASRGGLIRTLAARLFGHDYFLSYARQDSTTYAKNLVSLLEQRGLLVCFDLSDFQPGDPLGQAMARRVRRSHRLLLIDTSQARRSRYVADEIRHAFGTGLSILRIADGASAEFAWGYVDPEQIARMEDIIRVDESAGAIAQGAPSDLVLNAIIHTARKSRSLRRFWFAAAVLLLLGASVAGLAWNQFQVAASRQLASNAERFVETAPAEALTFAIQAGRRHNTDEARRSLSRALSAQRLRMVLHHSEPVRYARFSPDGSKVSSVSEDGTSRVWDAWSGALLLTFRDRAEGPAAATSNREQATLWAPEHGKQLFSLCQNDQVKFPGMSPDCFRVVTATGAPFRRDGRVWDVQSGRHLFALLGHSLGINGASFSPDGHLIVTASNDETVRIWDALTGRLLRILEGCRQGAVNSIAFSERASTMVTAGDNKAACIWDTRTWRKPLVLGHAGAVTDAQFSADGSMIVTASADHTARVWNAKSGAAIRVLTGHKAPLTHAEFSGDGSKIITSSGDLPSHPPGGPDKGTLRNFDASVRVWDAHAGVQLYILRGHEEIARYAAFSHDGTRVVSAGDDTVRLWSENGRSLDPIPPNSDTVGFSARGKDTSADGVRVLHGRRVLDLRTNRELLTLQDGVDGDPQATAFSADGSRVVGVFQQAVQLWDARTGRALSSFEFEDTSDVSPVTISPDGTRVAGVHDYTEVSVWDTTTGRRITDFDGSTAAWSPDGRAVVTVLELERSAVIWDASSGNRIHTLPGGSEGLYDAVFSPDGSMILTTGQDGVIRVWDSRNGRDIDRFTRSDGATQGAAFSLDGRYVLAYRGAKVVGVYPIRFKDLLDLAQAHLPRSVGLQD